jgi:repressor LexA
MNKMREIRRSKKLTMKELGNLVGVSESTISLYETGKHEPDIITMGRIADALSVSVDELLGRDTLGVLGILPVTPRAVPILGDIACGTPITAEQNIEGYADLPEGVWADFALRCKGDSMEPTFLDGDLVLIRQEGDVSDGRIAAVLLDSETDTEATLKRVHHVPGGLILIPDNQKKYGPRTFQGSEAAKIRILGVAVGYVRMI